MEPLAKPVPGIDQVPAILEVAHPALAGVTCMRIFHQTPSGRMASALAALILVLAGEFWTDDLSLVIAGALL